MFHEGLLTGKLTLNLKTSAAIYDPNPTLATKQVIGIFAFIGLRLSGV